MAPNDVLLDKGVLGPGSAPNPTNTRNIDFDVMEIANGTKDTDFPSWRRVRRDWLSLLNQGVFRPGTGVSDSHRITVEHAGWARTFVRGVGNDPANFGISAFDDQVKAGNMVVSGGPYIEFTAKSPATGATAGVGGMLGAPDGQVRLTIKVTAAAWIPVEEVRVIANGFVVAAFDVTTSPNVKPAPTDFQSTGGIDRFSATLTRAIAQDTYFIVEAGAKLPASVNTLPPPPIVDVVEPGVVPVAFTNPIFVDEDGNATFDPPGLPVMMASNAGGEEPGFWAHLRRGLAQLAARLAGAVVAEGPPGEMTGVTKEEKAEAMRKGEYFPLREFTIPAGAVEAARQAEEAASRGGGPAGTREPPAGK